MTRVLKAATFCACNALMSGSSCGISGNLKMDRPPGKGSGHSLINTFNDHSLVQPATNVPLVRPIHKRFQCLNHNLFPFDRYQDTASQRVLRTCLESIKPYPLNNLYNKICLLKYKGFLCNIKYRIKKIRYFRQLPGKPDIYRSNLSNFLRDPFANQFFHLCR